MSMFLRRVLNRLWPVSLDAASASRRIVAPAADHGARPSFYLPGEFDAVLGCVNGDAALEWRRVSGAVRHALPTVEYVLENVHLDGERIAAGRYVGRYRTNRPVTQPAPADGPDHIPQAVLSTNILSGLEFGHWVRDSLVIELHGANEGVPAVALARQPWPHEPAFRDVTGRTCHYMAHGRIGRLLILDDRGHNDYWTDRFRTLRHSTRQAAIGSTGASAGPLVFLSRGGGARMRDPANIEAIGAALEALGFQTVNPSDMTIPQVASALRDARMVVSVEGSNLNHLHFFAPDGVALVCLQNPHRFYAYHKGLMDIYDGLFGFVVGRPDPDIEGRYLVNIDHLKRTIDLAERRP